MFHVDGDNDDDDGAAAALVAMGGVNDLRRSVTALVLVIVAV